MILIGTNLWLLVALVVAVRQSLDITRGRAIGVVVPNKTILKALDDLKALGFNSIYLASPKYNLKRLRMLSPEELGKVKQILLRIESGYYKRLKRDSRPYMKKGEFRQYLLEATPEQLAQTLRTVAILSQSKVYLLWRNPTYFYFHDTNGLYMSLK